MQKNTYGLLRDKFNIAEQVLDLIERSENEVEELFAHLDDVMAYNQYKVLDAFQKKRNKRYALFMEYRIWI